LSKTPLHALELKVLSALKGGTWVGFDSLVSETGLGQDQLRRALEWLSSKSYVEQDQAVESKTVSTSVDVPELRLVRLLRQAGHRSTLDELKKAFGSSQEFSAALGRARAASWIEIASEGKTTLVRLTNSDGPAKLEELVKRLSAGVDEGSVPPEWRELLSDLLKRGLAKKVEHRSTRIRATEEGVRNAGLGQAVEYLEKLTPELLASGDWKTKPLRPINVDANAPRFFPGRRHPVRDFIREVREAYISMGFTEIEGSNIQPSFWNFDALFIAQDHPGREMQDTFYIKGINDERIKRSGTVAHVASVHENGWVTGSKGWGYSWDIEEARRLVLRTHNTSLTVQSLARTGETETRVFALGKAYRNESLDYKHLAEFHQMDGIIVGDGMTARHLMGFLVEFYKKLGFKVKIWPSYFPYTEPSLQAMFYSETSKRWLELGGSGVFRPEVTWPLGVRKPVLAWGLGIERLILLRSGLDDLRVLYDNDLGWLRRRTELASSETVQR
jgi:phenylalanyl-tRNA synthetase alpha chain